VSVLDHPQGTYTLRTKKFFFFGGVLSAGIVGETIYSPGTTALSPMHVRVYPDTGIMSRIILEKSQIRLAFLSGSARGTPHCRNKLYFNAL
jgi:hypothetical protein